MDCTFSPSDIYIPHLLVGVKVSSPSVVNTSDSDSESEEMTMALDLSAMILEEKDPSVAWKLGSSSMRIAVQ